MRYAKPHYPEAESGTGFGDHFEAIQMLSTGVLNMLGKSLLVEPMATVKQRH